MKQDNFLMLEYFPQTPHDQAWSLLENNIYYRTDYLAYSDNGVLELDEGQKEAYGNPFIFFVSPKKGEQCIYKNSSHGFHVLLDEPFIYLASENTPESGRDALQIRTKNSQGEWQDWQAMCTYMFGIFRDDESEGNAYLNAPIMDELEDLKNNIEIRHAGKLWVSKVTGERQILTDDDLIVKISPFTNRIEPFMDCGNPGYSFADRTADLKRFEEKYYRYDSDGKRI